MSWFATGAAVVGAVAGSENAKAQKKSQDAQNIAAATQTEYSPWTNMGPGKLQTGAPTQLGGAMAGGMQGAMFGAQFDKPVSTGDSPANKLNTEQFGPAAGGTQMTPEEMKRMQAAGQSFNFK